MPFRERGRLEQRVSILRDYDTGAFTVSGLCETYGISRQTFYAWLGRRASGEADWFSDRSLAPKRVPARTGVELARELVAVRRRFPRFGPKKIKAWLERTRPDAGWVVGQFEISSSAHRRYPKVSQAVS